MCVCVTPEKPYTSLVIRYTRGFRWGGAESKNLFLREESSQNESGWYTRATDGIRRRRFIYFFYRLRDRVRFAR